MLLSGRVPNSKSAALQISKYVEREILNHTRLNHPHIVELKEVSTAAGGDMFQLVVRQRGLPEADARWYFQQLIIAIDYCHRMVSLRAVCQLRGR